MMDGVEFVEVVLDEQTREAITGITELRMRILTCFSPSVQKIYGVAA